MSWVLIAFIGYCLTGLAALFDKFLLSTKVRPWQYVFYVGLFEIFALVLVPFGFGWPATNAILFAVFSGLIFILALIPLYFLVNRTEVTRASPLVGAFVPIFTLIFSSLLLRDRLSAIELIAFFFLVLGGIAIIFRRKFIPESTKNLGLALFSAILFAASFVAIKASFDAGANFISGYVIARMGGFLLALIGYFIFRSQFKRSLVRARVKLKAQLVWVGVSKLLAGIAFLTLNYAIFLGDVSLVQALQGVQYVFLLIMGAILGVFITSLREKFSPRVILLKVFAVILIGIGLMLLSLNYRSSTNPGQVDTYGVTFSTLYTDELGLDYQDLFQEILGDLGVRNFRLIAYWPEIEPQSGEYDFRKLDWLLDKVGEYDGKVIFTLGRRVPRSPECHIPDWASELNEKDQQEKVLSLIGKIVNRYKSRSEIVAWQVENEPFLPVTSNLGKCPGLDVDFLEREIFLVKSLDARPVIITDSGELSDWVRAYKRADIFGTSIYRVIWVGAGYFHHPFSPEFFFVKENLVKLLYGTKKIITVELQAEPWGPEQTYLLDIEERRKSMDLEQLKSNIAFAEEVGHSEVYLWGVEWWYWEKSQGYGEFWEEAKKSFNNK